jgi:predicted ferric reductase
VLIGGLALLLTGLLAYTAATTAPGQRALAGLNWLFGLNSPQLWWYVTRSSAMIAYLLLWLSTAWGLAVPSKIITPLIEPAYTFDFHQFISLLGIGFMLLHISVLMLDRYQPASLWQILIPFLTTYRPLWVGIGILSFYIILIVTLTFYLRTRIGMRAFRLIHLFSLLSYLGITLHGLFAGTDAVLPSTKLIYALTGLSIIFLTVYWLVLRLQPNQEPTRKAPAEHPKTAAR